MKSYMLLIGFIGLFTCSLNITAMGGPGVTYLSFDLEEENEATSGLPVKLEQKIRGLPQELQEVVIIKTLDSMLKEQLPKEKAELSTFVRRYLALLGQPLLRPRNRKYFLNRLAHKFFLTFGRHLKVPGWYLIKYFGEPGKEWYFKQIWTLRKDILDYSFSLLELIKHNKFNRKIKNGRLDLSNLRLKNLEGLLKIPNIETVTTLFLHDNQLKEFPKQIANLPNLRILFLSNNQLKEFPKQIANLPNLQELYLDTNQLKELPKQIANLHNLQKLSLNDNQLKEFPKQIANLHNLQKLYLRDNQLKELPKEITNLSNLQELYLRDNQLKELPKEIANLHNLQKLYLSNNQLKELPKEIANLHNLQELYLSNNQDLKEQEAMIRKMLPEVTITF